VDPKGTKKDPASYAAIRAAVEEGYTLVGYERENGLRSLAPLFYAAEVEIGLAAEIAPSLFSADGKPKEKDLGRAILAARAANVRWSRIAVYLGRKERAAERYGGPRSRGKVRAGPGPLRRPRPSVRPRGYESPEGARG
jgi:hypothetical protein